MPDQDIKDDTPVTVRLLSLLAGSKMEGVQMTEFEKPMGPNWQRHLICLDPTGSKISQQSSICKM